MTTQGRDEAVRRTTTALRRGIAGFTLIELLVVIAIIGLLMSILLPSLRTAKEAARSVMCRAHLRGAGLGVSTYIENWDSWLPGPNTSGLRIGKTGQLPAVPSDPVQNVDWISPSMGDELGFMDEQVDRLYSMFNTELCCPSNKVRYDYAYPGNITGLEPESLHYSSYSAPIVHHMVNEDMLEQKLGSTSGWVTDEEISGKFIIPKSYRPKQSRVGSPGQKIWAMDGARYYDDETDQTSFNDLTYQNDGGNFMLTGPVYNRSGDPYLLDIPDIDPESWSLTEPALRLAYRHRGRINAVFMDGHCETMDLLESLDETYYFPRNTEVTSTGRAVLRTSSISSGTIK